MPMTNRLFVAIDLPEDVARRLARIVAAPPPGVRPTRPAQMHLTLHFLGDVAEETMPDLRGRLAQVRGTPFAIDLTGIGRFPPRGRPTVLWAGIDLEPALADLHGRIGDAVARSGIPVERRPYVPHVTLARLTPRAAPSWADERIEQGRALAIRGLPVDRFVLYSSVPADGGTEHVVEAVYPLGGTVTPIPTPP